jgi:BASS family bile acid:Na+ symporter
MSATFVVVALNVAIWLIVLAQGARVTMAEALSVVRRPTLLAPALVAIFLIPPAFALFLSSVFALPPAIKLALVVLSAAPVPPLIPVRLIKLGVSAEYAIGLLVAAGFASLVLTPVLVFVMSHALGRYDVQVSTAMVARVMLLTVGLPLAAGIALRRYAPRFADLVQDLLQSIGMVLGLLVLALLLAASWKTMLSLVGNGALAAIAALIVVSLVAGHLLGGKQAENKIALALASAARHLGVGLAIATASFPDRAREAQGAILLFLIVNLVVTTPYIRWMQGRRADVAPSLRSGHA